METTLVYWGYIGVIFGLYWDNGKENGNYSSILGLYWGYIGIMEKKMETTLVYWGYIGIMALQALDPGIFLSRLLKGGCMVGYINRELI